MLNQKEEARKTLGYLPQEFGVYPKISAEVERLLRQTNLWDAQKKKLRHMLGRNETALRHCPGTPV